MRAVSQGYKDTIKSMGRQIDSIITYYNHYKVLSENNYYILTEDGTKILTEQVNDNDTVDILAEDTFGSKIIVHGGLLSTMMREFDFEVRQDIKTGSIVSFKFGVKVNDDYEYIDYGKFIVHQKEFNEDTKTYSYVAYDYMLFTMTPFKAPNLSEWIGEYTLFDLANYICDTCGLELGMESFPNSERVVNDSTLKYFQTNGLTNRDVLDLLTEVTGCSSYMDNNVFIIDSPTTTNEILTADSFKDSDVKFDKVYGPINSILFSRGEDAEDTIEIKDDDSIATNGVTQIKIKDNPFLEGNDRSDYFDEMFNVLNGLTYSLNDVSSVGITYLDYLDEYKVQIGENEYNCLLLNDEITIEQGLQEKIFTEEPEETTKEYTTSRLSDKEEKWANIQVKKDLAEISLEVGQKVDNNEVISAINLSPEQIEINSNKISLSGKTIALTSDNIAITSSNFNVDTNGNMTCGSATITNGNINLTSVGQNAKFIVKDYENANASWSQSARVINWNGVGGGLLQMTNYLSGGGTIVCKSNDNTQSSMTAYEIKAPTITPGSKEELKKNFEKFDNGLDMIEKVDIYKYNLKFEKDSDKKHIGLVIGDKYKYSKEITNKENDGVDLYSMISVLWQAVKEQQKEIEELKERIGK